MGTKKWRKANREKVNKAMSAYRKANREKVNLWNRRSRKIVRDFVTSLKTGPCTDCGQKFAPYVMQFDHRGGKAYTVSRMRNHSQENILEEVAKCDLVCANCHAIRTYMRRVASTRVDRE